jgi:hypothetical protein
VGLKINRKNFFLFKGSIVPESASESSLSIEHPGHIERKAFSWLDFSKTANPNGPAMPITYPCFSVETVVSTWQKIKYFENNG